MSRLRKYKKLARRREKAARREQWLNNRMERIFEVEFLLQGMCVYDTMTEVYYDTGPNRNEKDSTMIVCKGIDRDFFMSAVVPEVWKEVTKKYPGSRVAIRTFEHPSGYSGGLIVTWQPEYIYHPKKLRDFWRDYNKYVGTPYEGVNDGTTPPD